MDVNEELRETESSGKIVLGSNETLDATRSGESKLTIISTTCPGDVEEDIRKYSGREKVPLYYYPGGGKELGLALGKPFLVSTMAIIDTGDSNIRELGDVLDEDQLE
ncbi:hypothetical protein AKJ57_06140 [candidate division MSBL1 archaeon SCGC-AAA259A05]|uniref:Large ribosomal subunit protein eL30 n=1 Tax=candidate division MSBL1 archaeon SCGC-AAA259A05 TaxID=1698259 RepID=A0A133U3Z9_9EURY|nr:hypothetical protein AKJ57_06140 [candidate division MSBL1 archaeon SCGC-AAA259A05]